MRKPAAALSGHTNTQQEIPDEFFHRGLKREESDQQLPIVKASAILDHASVMTTTPALACEPVPKAPTSAFVGETNGMFYKLLFPRKGH